MDTTVAKLRHVLAAYFPLASVNTVLGKVRRAEIIPCGTAGYGGVGSAPVDTVQAVSVLLALASSTAHLDPRQDIETIRLARSPPMVHDTRPDNFMGGLIADVENAAAGQRPGAWRLSFEQHGGVKRSVELPSALITDIGGLFTVRDEAAA
jgi:hypothetical protein